MRAARARNTPAGPVGRTPLESGQRATALKQGTTSPPGRTAGAALAPGRWHGASAAQSRPVGDSGSPRAGLDPSGLPEIRLGEVLGAVVAHLDAPGRHAGRVVVGRPPEPRPDARPRLTAARADLAVTLGARAD